MKHETYMKFLHSDPGLVNNNNNNTRISLNDQSTPNRMSGP